MKKRIEQIKRSDDPKTQLKSCLLLKREGDAGLHGLLAQVEISPCGLESLKRGGQNQVYCSDFGTSTVCALNLEHALGFIKLG